MNETDSAENPGSPEEGNGNVTNAVSAARWLFITLGVTWLVFGVWSIIRMGSTEGNIPAAFLWIIVILMFVNTLVLFWIGWGIGRGSNLYYYFGILVLAGNIFLTFTDEFGIFDLVTLLINVSLLVLLIVYRSKFLSA